jgi:hypothetical protein
MKAGRFVYSAAGALALAALWPQANATRAETRPERVIQEPLPHAHLRLIGAACLAGASDCLEGRQPKASGTLDQVQELGF